MRRRIPLLFLLIAAAGLALAPPAPARYHLRKAFWGEASDFGTFRQLGVNIAEHALYWSDIAPTRPRHPRDPNDPAYQWPSGVGSFVRAARRRHMQMLLMPIFSPGWANGNHDRAWAPTSTRTYTDFLYAATRRYPSVRFWLIWGEANGINFHPQGGSPGRAYARLLDASYGLLKKRNKHNKVLGGNTFTRGTTPPFPFVRSMRLSHGRRPRLDFFAHNPFTRRKPDLSNPPSGGGRADMSDLRRFGRAIDHNLGRRHHRHIPLFISEWCEPTDAGDSEFNWYVTRSQQASWTKAAFSVARKVHAYAFGWIHLRDIRRSDGYYSNCGLLTTGGQRKPAYSTFEHAR